LKQKIQNQEIQLSQMKYPQQAPVSTVSYEKLGIGQQNALNQANLENIQKNIETSSHLKTLKLTCYEWGLFPLRWTAYTREQLLRSGESLLRWEGRPPANEERPTESRTARPCGTCGETSRIS